jgi:hypothetical protein
MGAAGGDPRRKTDRVNADGSGKKVASFKQKELSKDALSGRWPRLPSNRRSSPPPDEAASVTQSPDYSVPANEISETA